MADIISSLSQQFGRALVLGALLPMAVFLTIAALSMGLLFPPTGGLLAAATNIQVDRLLILAVITLGMTGLLHNLNGPIIRFFEGYPWRQTWWGRWRSAHFRQQLQALQERQAELAAQLAQPHAPDDVAALYKEIGEVVYRLRREYPLTTGSVLPTRLGNVIRSYEHYPRRQYGMSSITLWPRLLGVMDSNYAAMIGDAKIAFDFMLNSALLNALLVVALLFVGLFPEAARTLLQAGATSANFYAIWAPLLTALLVATVLFYRSAVGQAFTWGELVKGAFDLYRWELLEKMGYRCRPQSVAEERKLWRNISQQIIYGDPPQSEPVPYSMGEATEAARAVMASGKHEKRVE